MKMSSHDASTNTGSQFDNEHGKEPQFGDMLEFQRGSHIQYALYVGNGKVMSIDVEDNPSSNSARVRQHNLGEVCHDDNARIKSHEEVAMLHFNLTVRHPQDILKSAKSFEDKVVPYEFDYRNCEYYCSLWRYGKGFSTQAAEKKWNPAESNSSCRSSKPTSAKCHVMDGYEKYKQLAEDRLEEYENSR